MKLFDKDTGTKHQWRYGFLIPAADNMVANLEANLKLLYEKASRRGVGR